MKLGFSGKSEFSIFWFEIRRYLEQVYQCLCHKSKQLFTYLLSRRLVPTLLFKINVAKVNKVWKFYRGLCS